MFDVLCGLNEIIAIQNDGTTVETPTDVTTLDSGTLDSDSLVIPDQSAISDAPPTASSGPVGGPWRFGPGFGPWQPSGLFGPPTAELVRQRGDWWEDFKAVLWLEDENGDWWCEDVDGTAWKHRDRERPRGGRGRFAYRGHGPAQNTSQVAWG